MSDWTVYFDRLERLCDAERSLLRLYGRRYSRDCVELHCIRGEIVTLGRHLNPIVWC